MTPNQKHHLRKWYRRDGEPIVMGACFGLLASIVIVFAFLAYG